MSYMLVVFVVLQHLNHLVLYVWFAIGALAGCVAALLGANWIVQAVVFLVVTMVVLIFIRPFAIKYVNNKAKRLMLNQWQVNREKLLWKLITLTQKE